MNNSMRIIPGVVIGIIFSVMLFFYSCPILAVEPGADNLKKSDQAESLNKGQRQEIVNNNGLQFNLTARNHKPKGASFIRLKPKSRNDGITGSEKVFDVEFMDDETSEQMVKSSPEGGPYVKFEKIEDPEKNNILVRKTLEKDYKTEMSMGVKVSPYSEICFGKGFLLNKKDDFNVDPRDNGWRLKFKFNF